MLTCRVSGKQISRLVDNDLPDEEATALKNHITSCIHCSNRYAEYGNISGLVKHAFTNTTKPHYVHTNCSKSNIPFHSLIKPVVAGLSVVVTVLVVFSFVTLSTRNTGTIPTLSEVHTDKMNTPLGALLYYFEHDNTTVTSQFLSISQGTITSSTDTLQLTYSSPLFDDNSGIELYSLQNYK